MKTRNLTVAAAAAILAVTPALAQMSNGSMSSGQMPSGSMSSGQMSNGSMASDPSMKMSAADKKTMAKCQGMPHDMMMKNRSCMKMMKMHPEMMPSS